MSQIFEVTDASHPDLMVEVVEAASTAVANGELVVIPTESSYAVICDAFNVEAVSKLRSLKNLPATAPLSVAAGNSATIDGIATFPQLARDLTSAFWPGALTVLTSAQPSVNLAVKSEDVTVAVQVPNHQVAIAVLNAIGPCAISGAQMSGQTPIRTIDQARANFGDSVTIYIGSGELSGQPSSVVSAVGEQLRLVRAGALSLAELREVIPMIVDATKTAN